MNRVYIFFVCVLFIIPLNAQKLLLIDTGFNDPYHYHNFSLLARSVGFDPAIVPFYEVTPTLINQSNCIILVIDENAAHNFFLHTDADLLVQKMKNIFELLKQQESKLVCLWFPSKMGESIKETIDHALAITKAACAIPHSLQGQLPAFFKFLFQPDYKRSSEYHTSLLTKHDHTKKKMVLPYKPHMVVRRCSNDIISTTLPLGAFPLGWYGAHPHLNMQFFITKTSLMTFAEITEQFTYNPFDFATRLKKLNELQQLLDELYNALLLGKISTGTHLQKPPLPAIFNEQQVINEKNNAQALRAYEIKHSLYDWIDKQKIWAGLITLDAYKNKEQEAADTLLSSGLNLLWVELCPELYLSKNGVKKDQKDIFWQQLAQFTNALYERALMRNQRPPFLYVGFELTGNFNETIKNPVVDSYGKVYTKIPSPFDFEQVWNKELLEPLDILVRDWSKYNNVPISGIFLDFEMYHAKNQASQYNADMDFSDCAWTLYCKVTKQRHAALLKAHDARISFLMKQNKWKEYFSVLENEAYLLGKKIKEHIKKIVPQALIAIYNIYPPYNWFYNGMIGGLSSPQEPALLATFNNDFYSHNRMFRAHKIYAYHMPVFLLSKFKEPADFELINTVGMPFHDGVWFNRISRLQESRNPKDWSWDFGVEVTPLSTSVFTKQLAKHMSTIQEHAAPHTKNNTQPIIPLNNCWAFEEHANRKK